jgi:hypothetical protein
MVSNKFSLKMKPVRLIYNAVGSLLTNDICSRPVHISVLHYNTCPSINASEGTVFIFSNGNLPYAVTDDEFIYRVMKSVRSV